ncbi:MAG: CRISPR-associated protein Cas4 [Anaerolineae bacterium]|nr:CRISPR-associated protein Cas4 [Anaerolineae bacterium]
MPVAELPDYLPLSFLNQYVYCARRFWLMYAQNEMEVNAPVLEGILRHERAHDHGQQTDEQGRVQRSVHVWSDNLRIKGVADFVEERNGTLLPVEHKRGRMGDWINDHVQLCAQALCLEERTTAVVPYGEIFYWANRRRERVSFDDALRQHTIQIVAQLFDLLTDGRLPAPIDHPAKCRDCSLEPICLPRETLRLLKEDH